MSRRPRADHLPRAAGLRTRSADRRRAAADAARRGQPRCVGAAHVPVGAAVRHPTRRVATRLLPRRLERRCRRRAVPASGRATPRPRPRRSAGERGGSGHRTGDPGATSCLAHPHVLDAVRGRDTIVDPLGRVERAVLPPTRPSDRPLTRNDRSGPRSPRPHGDGPSGGAEHRPLPLARSAARVLLESSRPVRPARRLGGPRPLVGRAG